MADCAITQLSTEVLNRAATTARVLDLAPGSKQRLPGVQSLLYVVFGYCMDILKSYHIDSSDVPYEEPLLTHSDLLSLACVSVDMFRACIPLLKTEILESYYAGSRMKYSEFIGQLMSFRAINRVCKLPKDWSVFYAQRSVQEAQHILDVSYRKVRTSDEIIDNVILDAIASGPSPLVGNPFGVVKYHAVKQNAFSIQGGFVDRVISRFHNTKFPAAIQHTWGTDNVVVISAESGMSLELRWNLAKSKSIVPHLNADWLSIPLFQPYDFQFIDAVMEGKYLGDEAYVSNKKAFYAWVLDELMCVLREQQKKIRGSSANMRRSDSLLSMHKANLRMLYAMRPNIISMAGVSVKEGTNFDKFLSQLFENSYYIANTRKQLMGGDSFEYGGDAPHIKARKCDEEVAAIIRKYHAGQFPV